MFLGTNMKILRKQLKKSQEEVAADLGLTRSSYSGYENGIAEPGLESLVSIAKYFKVSLEDLILKDFEKLTDSEWKAIETGMYKDISGGKLRVLATTVDAENNELIEMIPQEARAGYTTGYSDPDYLKVLPAFNLPFLSRDRKYRSFPIAGDSMPPVVHGSQVIAEYIQNWATIKDGTPCIVVTKEDGIVFKIVNNYLNQDQTFELCSTNPIYEPYRVRVNEIIEIWKFVNYMSPEFTEFKSDDSHVAKSIQNLQREIQDLKSMISGSVKKDGLQN
jgi:transcriptional regulator with XRE-family HTH domain